MPGAHAALSPSAAKRWCACPPSARLCQKYIEKFGEKSSEYAEEGTMAHALAELKLRKELGKDEEGGINDYNYKKQRKALGDIPKDMDRYTDDYVDVVLEKYYGAKRVCPEAKLFIEQRLDMSNWIPGCFGTSDAIVVSDQGLYVMDLKYGKGVPVDAVGNYQARIYALGAINEFGSLYGFKEIQTIIIQPRLDSVTDEILLKEDVLKWAEEYVVPKAQLAWKGEGEFCAGEHCRFCVVRALCKERALHAFGIFNHIFDSPDVIDEKDIPTLLEVSDVAMSWLKDLKDYALSQALQGQEYRGYKLVKGKRPSRVWKNDDDVLDILCHAGYSEDQYLTPRKLKSVSEMEKMLHKGAFDALLGSLVFQGDGALTLVPESDKREAYSPLELAFADLSENSSQ